MCTQSVASIIWVLNVKWWRKVSKYTKTNLIEVFGPRQSATSDRLFKRTFGNGDDSLRTRKKNAFRYPKDPEAVYPQYEKPVYIEKRQRYLPTEYLIKNTGEKPKNRIKREQEEALQREFALAEGKINEGKAIDVDDMEGIVDDVEDMEIEEGNNNKNKNKNKRKEKDYGMDIDDITGKPSIQKVRRNKKKGYRHKQKSKYIMKY